MPGYAQVRPPERPILKIVAPEPGSTVLGSQITLEYIISGITLVATEEAKINIIGEGNLKLTFAREGYPVPTPTRLARNSPITFENIPEGSYQITMEVVRNNGISHSPPVKDTTKFQVVYPITPTPTLTPVPSPTPLPFQQRLRDRLPVTRQQLWISLGVILIIGPTVYLLLHKVE